MIPLFTPVKPFQGHSAVILRNALKGWKLPHPDIEIILFGDDEGAAHSFATAIATSFLPGSSSFPRGFAQTALPLPDDRPLLGHPHHRAHRPFSILMSHISHLPPVSHFPP
jgi:hypothetical protein